mmetsp:Transcript_10918/g.32315  ORF Transcript_10918/g.32315 Transcript_10918/m.32315 type:complete len:330 (-) Transcript_10918:27-1016(-)
MLPSPLFFCCAYLSPTPISSSDTLVLVHELRPSTKNSKMALFSSADKLPEPPAPYTIDLPASEDEEASTSASTASQHPRAYCIVSIRPMSPSTSPHPPVPCSLTIRIRFDRLSRANSTSSSVDASAEAARLDSSARALAWSSLSDGPPKVQSEAEDTAASVTVERRARASIVWRTKGTGEKREGWWSGAALRGGGHSAAAPRRTSERSARRASEDDSSSSSPMAANASREPYSSTSSSSFSASSSNAEDLPDRPEGRDRNSAGTVTADVDADFPLALVWEPDRAGTAEVEAGRFRFFPSFLAFVLPPPPKIMRMGFRPRFFEDILCAGK